MSTPVVPSFLTRCANDEFTPPPLNDVEQKAASLATEVNQAASERLRMSVTGLHELAAWHCCGSACD